jgi:NADH dehydrogenase
MATRSVATVFGGSGFIGRYVVKRLAAAGHVVRVAVRDPEAALFLKPMGAVGQVALLSANVTRAGEVARAVEGADLVVNLVGILAERRPGDFHRIQGEAPGLVARVAAASGVRRLVQMSAIGADPGAASQYARSKGEGEAAARAAFPGVTVLRPSLVFGPEDQFFNRFGAMAAMSPIMPVIAGASRFQPVYVGDVADAVMAALTRDDAAGRVYELGGPQVWTFRELLVWILAQTRRRRLLIDIPMGFAQAQANILERLPGKLLTRDQLLLLAQDNVYQGLAHELAKARDVLYLGRGLSYPIALEGALKLKEISYIHAEGYAAGEMKHGPIALIDENVPVVVLAPYDSLFDKTISNMQEVMARKGKVILVSDKRGLELAGNKVWARIEVPEVDPFITPLLYSIPVQLLAYHTAVVKGTDVDQPRNLAKSVTVE